MLKLETPVQRPTFTKEEFWKIHDAAEPQMRVMLLTYLETAARKSELTKLEWRNVDLTAGTITLHTAKRTGGTEADVVQISPDLASALREMRKANMGAQFVFTAPTGEKYGRSSRMLLWLCKKAGVEHKGWHGIRRLAATLAAQHGGIADAYAVLRHRNLSTTDKYVKALAGSERRVSIVELARAKGE